MVYDARCLSVAVTMQPILALIRKAARTINGRPWQLWWRCSFGPVCPQGYGIGYGVQNDMMHFWSRPSLRLNGTPALWVTPVLRVGDVRSSALSGSA